MSSRFAAAAPPWLESGTRVWWVAYLLGPLVLLGVAVALFPDLVYGRYVWQYLWGPVVADAAGGPVTRNGITAVKGYNLGNTITYLSVVLYALPGVREFFRTFDVRVDTRLAYGLLPLVVAGGVMRALQDTGLLAPPLDRLFLTPLIYFVMAGGTVVALLAAVGLREHADIALPVTVGTVGTLWTLGGLGVAVAYGLGPAGTLRLWVPVAVVAAAGLLTVGFYVGGSVIDQPAVTHPLLVVLVFGQLVDASQIFLGVALFDYAPKLFVTQLIYEMTGIPGTTFVVKVAATGLIVWVLADYNERMDETWWWLVAFVGTAVGLAPGVHGIVRIMLGV